MTDNDVIALALAAVAAYPATQAAVQIIKAVLSHRQAVLKIKTEQRKQDSHAA